MLTIWTAEDSRPGGLVLGVYFAKMIAKNITRGPNFCGEESLTFLNPVIGL